MKKIFTLSILLITIATHSQLIPRSTNGITHQAVQFTSNQTGFVWAYAEPDGTLANGLLRKTTDEGNTWTSLPVTFSPTLAEDPATNTIINQKNLQFIDDNTGFCAGILNSELLDAIMFLKTTDGGVSWIGNPFTPNVTIECIFFKDSNNGFTGCPQKLYKTSDGGITWSVVIDTSTPTSFGGTFYSIYFLNTNVGFASTTGRMYKTSDGGTSWNLKTIESGNSTQNINSIKFITDQIGFATTSNGKIFRTIDGGENWTTNYDEIGNDQLTSLSIINNKIIAGGYDMNETSLCNTFIITSTNNGANWTKECYNFPFAAPRWVFSLFFITDTKGFLGVDSGMYEYNTTALSTATILSQSFTMYPNPAKDFVTVNLGNNNLEALPYNLLDISGRILKTGILNNNDQIDLSTYSSGVYFLSLADYSKSVRIIKE